MPKFKKILTKLRFDGMFLKFNQQSTCELSRPRKIVYIVLWQARQEISFERKNNARILK